MILRAAAPAKVNLCLALGRLRGDGRHELVTLFESISLADELLSQPSSRDEVLCPGLVGPNLVDAALAGLRARGWDGPLLRIEIRKRIPVAAGLGGGSADAAAALRIAQYLAPIPSAQIAELAAALGADVPSQVSPGVAIGTGAGELAKPVDPLAPHAFVVLPQPFGLSTADVYQEADRLGLPRSAEELARSLDDLSAALSSAERLPAELLVNDLQAAALSLRPDLEAALDAARAAGAEHALVSGSGPTVIGIFWGSGALSRAESAAVALAGRYPGARAAVAVSADFASPQSA